MPTVTINIRPEYIRAAIQSAAGLGLKFPSLAAERHIARFLNGVKWTVVGTSPETTPAEPEPSDQKFIVEFPLNGRWVRSTDYPETYTSAQADKIMTDDFTGIRVGYRINFASEEKFIIEFEFGGEWDRSIVYQHVYTREETDDILARNTDRPYRKTVYK